MCIRDSHGTVAGGSGVVQQHEIRQNGIIVPEAPQAHPDPHGVPLAPDAALDALSATGYDPVYGARPLRRAIQSTIADQAAGMLLDGSLRRGDVVTAQVREGKIVLTKTCERGMITP